MFAGVIFALEIHEGLPRYCGWEIECGDVGLLKNIPVWCKSFVAIHRPISWTVVEHANESRVAIQDGEGRYFKTDVEGMSLDGKELQ